MKFKVSSSALLKQLSGLSGVLSSNASLPILECFLFRIDKGSLEVSASDLETSVSTSLPIESKDSGTIAIPAKMIMDTLKAFPDQPLSFNIDEKKFSVEISSSYGKYKLTGHNGDDFPKMAELDKPSSFDIEAAVLSMAISKTMFAMGNDDLRPVMMGLFVKVGKDGATFVSTDAHKLVRYKRSDVKSKTEASYIVPKKPLVLLRGALSDGSVKVEFNNTNVSFSSEKMKIVSRLIDGKYPSYDSVIPKDNPNKMTIGRDAFLSSIRRVSIFSDKNSSQVKLSIKKGKLGIRAEDLAMSNEASESVECEYKGVDMEIGFNAKFLSEILSSIDGEEVVLELSEPNRAGVVVPKENSKEEDVLMLVMPVMITNQ